MALAGCLLRRNGPFDERKCVDNRGPRPMTGLPEPRHRAPGSSSAAGTRASEGDGCVSRPPGNAGSKPGPLFSGPNLSPGSEDVGRIREKRTRRIFPVPLEEPLGGWSTPSRNGKGPVPGKKGAPTLPRPGPPINPATVRKLPPVPCYEGGRTTSEEAWRQPGPPSFADDRPALRPRPSVRGGPWHTREGRSPHER